MTTVVEFPDRRVVAEEAAQWLIRLDGDVSPTDEELRALGEWLHRSPVHREELEHLATLWKRMNVLTELSVPLGHASRAGRLGRSAAAVRGRRGIGLVTAAAVIVLAVTSVWFARWWTTESYVATNGLYATAIGQQKTAPLADGSQVVLNTNSQIRVDYRPSSRDIHLIQGEALFTVAKDPTRPFRVYAGSRRVEALGTAFSVYLEGTNVSVTVTEGHVSLASVDSGSSGSTSKLRDGVESLGVLHAGQVATIRDGAVGNATAGDRALATIEPIDPEALAQRLAWRQGVLIFSGETLEQAVAELSRYTTVSIEIPDPAIRSMRIGGRFPVGETEAMLDALQANFDLRVMRLDHNRVVLSDADSL